MSYCLNVAGYNYVKIHYRASEFKGKPFFIVAYNPNNAIDWEHIESFETREQAQRWINKLQKLQGLIK